MAKASPAFQFYAQDFQNGTTLMSAAARGCYISMLCQSWTSGPIPNTPNAIAKAMSWGPMDPPYADLWAEIQPKWVLTEAGWINHRLEAVRAEQDAYREKMARLGKRGAQAKQAHADENTAEQQAHADQKHVISQAHAEAHAAKNSSPSVFDLRSSVFDLQTLPSPSPSERDKAALSRQTTADVVLANGQMVARPLAADHRRHLNCIGGGTWWSCVRGRCVPVRLVKDWQAQGFSEDYCQQVVDRYMEGIPEGTPLPSDAFRLWGSVWDAVHQTDALIPARRPSVMTKSDQTRENARQVLADIEAGRLVI